MAADDHNDVPVLDDPDTTKLQGLLDQYTDPSTTSQALVSLNKFIEEKPDKFFLKLAVIFSSSQNVATRLARQYVEAAELIELFLGMDNQNFFIGEVHDKAPFTNFIKFLFYLARARQFFPCLRDSVMKLLAKFRATEYIHMEAHYLDIYDVLNRMMIEPADPDKWYKHFCADLDWAGPEYCSAVSLIDNFVPAGISVDAFLKAAEMKMDENMVTGDWRAKHVVMVVVAKLEDGLIIQENRGVAPSDNLMKLLKLARVPLKVENGRLQWASATAIAKIGEAMKAVAPELIKKFAKSVISDLDKAYATCDTEKAQAAIKLASVIFST